MGKHTPGPWHAEPNKVLTQVIAADGLVVADITEDHGGIIEQHANAQVIAAAPDLLDACKRALKEAEDGLTVGCMEDLIVAIAKAEGRS